MHGTRLLLLSVLLAAIGAWIGVRWLEQSYTLQPYSLIEDGLYLGSAVAVPPPGTRAVVNLCGQKDPYEVDACHWDPVFEGGKEPTLDWLQQAVDFMNEQRREGRTTYVHCLAGMNRSGAVVTAYLMRKHGWNREQALAFVQARRPQVQPNPTLLRLLAEWEQRLTEQAELR